LLDAAKEVSMDTGLLRFSVGHFSCLAIKDGDEDDFDRNVLLINTGQQHVLVDTGNGHDFAPNRGLLLDRLRAVGILPTDIDVVILSHADWDHIGGAVDDRGTIAFPHARYVLARAEWDFWLSNSERLQPNDAYDQAFRQLAQTLPETRLAQLRDTLELIDPDTEIVPGIRSIAAPGHTPGYTVIAVASDADQLLYIGDLLYDPSNIENPDWYSVYDFDPAQVIVTRRQVWEQAARNQTLLMAYHIPFPGLGYVAQDGSSWRWRAFESPM
jgi:glyoxylase-like metal-dependent hydrolase (beta-lactamase superfamily II)